MGVILLSLGLNLMVVSGKGISSFDTVVLCMSMILKISFGTAVFLMQMIFMTINIIFIKKFKFKPRELIMSGFAIIVITIVISVFEFVIKQMLLGVNLTDSLATIIYMIGFLFLVNGITLIVITKLFVSPSDKFLVGMTVVLGYHYGTIKIFLDVLTLTLSFILIRSFNLDIKISIYTIVVTFFAGIFINIFTKFYKKLNM